MIGAQIGTYRVLRQLGEGGMGAVWLAEHVVLGRKVAIKVLHRETSQRPELVARFFNEAKAATEISDPGIVQIFDFGQHSDGNAYIVMELLEGEALDRRLTRMHTLSLASSLRILRQVASTLGAAHARGIVHRDVKPENIFLVRDPEVAGGERTKVLDFGIAKMNLDKRVKTHTSAVLGTPTFMSPEQCRGAGQVDQRSDVYSLGCVLFTLLTGRPPFDGEGPGDIIAMHLREPPPAPSRILPGIPPAVDALVLRCLAKDRTQRYLSGTELAAAVEQLQADPGVKPFLVELPLGAPAARAATHGGSAPQHEMEPTSLPVVPLTPPAPTPPPSPPPAAASAAALDPRGVAAAIEPTAPMPMTTPLWARSGPPSSPGMPAVGPPSSPGMPAVGPPSSPGMPAVALSPPASWNAPAAAAAVTLQAPRWAAVAQLPPAAEPGVSQPHLEAQVSLEHGSAGGGAAVPASGAGMGSGDYDPTVPMPPVTDSFGAARSPRASSAGLTTLSSSARSGPVVAPASSPPRRRASKLPLLVGGAGAAVGVALVLVFAGGTESRTELARADGTSAGELGATSGAGASPSGQAPPSEVPTAAAIAAPPSVSAGGAQEGSPGSGAADSEVELDAQDVNATADASSPSGGADVAPAQAAAAAPLAADTARASEGPLAAAAAAPATRSSELDRERGLTAIRQVVAAFAAWSKGRTSERAPCPKLEQLGRLALTPDELSMLSLTCQQQPADQRIGVTWAGPDRRFGTGDDLRSWTALPIEERPSGPRWAAQRPRSTTQTKGTTPIRTDKRGIPIDW